MAAVEGPMAADSDRVGLANFRNTRQVAGRVEALRRVQPHSGEGGGVILGVSIALILQKPRRPTALN